VSSGLVPPLGRNIKAVRKGQGVAKSSSEAQDLRGIVAAKISVHLRQQSIHRQTVTEKLHIIKVGNVVVKVNHQM